MLLLGGGQALSTVRSWGQQTLSPGDMLQGICEQDRRNQGGLWLLLSLCQSQWGCNLGPEAETLQM